MIFKRKNDLRVMANELLKTMTPNDAVKHCYVKQIETRKIGEEMSKRHMEEYLSNRKEQDKWKKLADFIINSKKHT